MAKQTRTVFGSHNNLAHVWAQQAGQAFGYSSDRRMFFEGATIFSYGHHFHIARFVTRKKKTCVLFTTQSYSSSTGKHKNIARGALHGTGHPIFYVHDVRHDPGATDIKAAQNKINEQVVSFARSTPYNSADDALRQIAGNAAAINDMAEFFGLRQRVKVPEVPADVIAKVQARIVKRDERRKVRDENRRIKYAAQEARTKAEYLLGDHHHLYRAEWGTGAGFSDVEHATHLAAWQIIEADKIGAWRAGRRISWGYGDGEPATMLRVNGENIETSRGAVFPVKHGRLAFALIAQCRHDGTAWERNGHKIALGTFQIDRVEADGTVKAGCHTVAWDEIERCARELGIVS